MITWNLLEIYTTRSVGHGPVPTHSGENCEVGGTFHLSRLLGIDLADRTANTIAASPHALLDCCPQGSHALPSNSDTSATISLH